jgi:hypothetical protein
MTISSIYGKVGPVYAEYSSKQIKASELGWMSRTSWIEVQRFLNAGKKTLNPTGSSVFRRNNGIWGTFCVTGENGDANESSSKRLFHEDQIIEG